MVQRFSGKLTKKNNEERSIEEPSEAVKHIQRMILDSLKPKLMSDFEDFNYTGKNKSVEEAIEEFESYRDEGYEWIVYGDVKSCYESINPLKSLKMIDSRIRHIPGITDKDYLPTGHPLSPLLANIYLGQFDKKAKHWDNCKLIRYVDDFWVMTQNKEEAEYYASESERIFDNLNLEIRVNVTPTMEGVDVLGYIIDSTSRRIPLSKEKENRSKVIEKVCEILYSLYHANSELSARRFKNARQQLKQYIHSLKTQNESLLYEWGVRLLHTNTHKSNQIDYSIVNTNGGYSKSTIQLVT